MLRRVAATVLLAVLLVSGVATVAAPAGADPGTPAAPAAPAAGDVAGSGAAPAAGPSQVTILGHGWGHGRGMGQYGALGYASGFADGTNWTHDQILGHFYGNTQPGTVGNPDIRVVLGTQTHGLNGYNLPTIVSADDTANRPLVNGVPIPAGNVSVMVWRAANGTVTIQYGGGCGGPWSAPAVAPSVVRIQPANDSAAARLEECRSHRHYRGDIEHRSICGGSGATTVCNWTVNVLPLDWYLWGVVPSEMPSSFGTEALRAQAVAARSYALADAQFRATRYGIAATCDSTSCQVYSGVANENGAATAAVNATSGKVRLLNGQPARTEFSSSTGGWTVGPDFPPVPDLGDAVPSNPHHTWTATLTAAQIAAKYGRTADQFLGIDVTSRNGLGDFGGRVLSLVVRFTNGNVTRTGEQFRSDFSWNPTTMPNGVRSDWFFVQIPYDQATANYVDRLFSDFVGRPATQQEVDAWASAIYNGIVTRLDLANAVAHSTEWATGVITDLYLTILDRSPDPGGLAAWVGALRSGTRMVDVAAGFLASNEFFVQRAESNPETYVRKLYETVLGRLADEPGVAAWTPHAQTPAGRHFVAQGFYASTESRRLRVTDFYQELLCRAPDPGGLTAWMGLLGAVDDLVLAATLATSNEYFHNAQSPKAC